MQKFLVVRANGATEVLTDPTRDDLRQAVGGNITGLLVAHLQARIGVLANEDAMAVNVGKLNQFATTLADMPIVGDVVVAQCNFAEGGFLSPWNDAEDNQLSMSAVAQIARDMNTGSLESQVLKGHWEDNYALA